MVKGSGLRVQGLGIRLKGIGFRLSAFGFRVQSFGLACDPGGNQNAWFGLSRTGGSSRVAWGSFRVWV